MVMHAVAPAVAPDAASAREEPGTPEEVWACGPRLCNLPYLDLSGCRRAVVVAPHPDDEAFGVGGTVATLLESGVPVTVVYATDGGPPKSRLVTESKAALAALGRPGGGALRAVRLHVADGGLERAERNATTLLTGLMRPGDWCFSTWERDGEPDHDAAGRIAGEAARRARAFAFTYPVSAWHQVSPDDPTLPWERACRVHLPAPALLRKGRAINCYGSRVAAMSSGELAHFTRPYEVVFS